MVNRDLLMGKLLELEIPEHLTITIARMLNTTSIDIGKGIKTYRGLPQGSVLSPALFSIYVSSLLIELKGTTLSRLAHADDICIAC